MTKTTKQLLCIFLIIAMCITSNPIVSFANETIAIFEGGNGTETDPYRVATPEQLNAVRNNLSAHYIQVADIDMSDWGNWEPIGKAIPSYSTANNSPLKLPENLFSGTYNGNNYCINNLKITNNSISPHYDCYGLFAGAENAVFKNIRLNDLIIDIDKATTDYVSIYREEKRVYSVSVGGIIGNASNANDSVSIINCNVNGKINVENCCDAYVGGIAGLCNNVNECFNGADIIVIANKEGRFPDNEKAINSNAYVGGIVGGSYFGSIIEECTNKGNIDVRGDSIELGGIIGRGNKIKNCVNLGDLSAKYGIYNVGGIAGHINNKIENSINYGDISADSTLYKAGSWRPAAGGIFATGTSSVILNSCYNKADNIYATGARDYYTTCLIGDCGVVELNDCYSFNSSITTGINSNHKGFGMLSKNDFLNESTYVGFDFENIWEIDSNIGGAVLKEFLTEESLTDITKIDEFTQQHLDFVYNTKHSFYDYATNDFRFANTLWKNMDSFDQNTAEFVHDIIEGSIEVITFQAFDGLESIKNPYDAILLDILASSTTQSFYEDTVKDDAFTISIGIINDTIKMFDNDFAWAEGFDIKKELKGLLYASDYSGNKLYEGLNTLFIGKGKNEIKAVFQGFECCGKILSNLSDGLSVVDCFVDMLRYTAAIEAYYNSSEIYKLILNDVASEMYKVNEKFAEKFNESLSVYTECMSYEAIMNSILKKGIGNGLILVQDLASDILADATFSIIMKAFKVGSEVAGKINAALWAADVGFSLSNMLTGNDTLVNCRRLLRANYMLDVASYNILKIFETTLKNTKSYGAALLFDNAFSFYKNVQLYSLNMYKTYCETSSTKLLSFNKKYFKDELEETVGRVKLWNNIYCHYNTEKEQGLRVETVVIACPTDVYVYRETDNHLMASIVNNKSTLYNDEVSIIAINGNNAIALDSLDNYRIEIKATNNSKMNVSYAKCQDLQIISQINFEPVNITKDNTYTLNTDENLIKRDDGVIIHQNGDIENCSCSCHKSGIVGFLWKIINFLQKIFGINPVCECGVAHY